MRGAHRPARAEAVLPVPGSGVAALARFRIGVGAVLCIRRHGRRFIFIDPERHDRT
jgi:hypothetical protein